MRRPTLWIALALLCAAGVIAALRMRGPRVDTVVVQRRDLEQHLVASGRVRAPARVQVAAPTGGLVVTVAANPGQRVHKGDLLVQLDDASERAAVAQAEAAVAQAQARVDQLERVGAIVATEGLRQAETNLAKARADLERSSRLAESGAVAAIELENARRAVEIAEAQRTAALAQQQAAGPRGADSRIALTALVEARARVTAASARLAQMRITALHDATVLSRDVEPGEVAQPSRKLLELAVAGDAELVFDPDERNLAAIRVGQPAKAAADAFPKDVFDAEVRYIAPSVDPARGSVEIRLAVAKPPAFLRPDMTVSIDLTLASRRQVLVVPSEVVRAGSPSPSVDVVEDGRVVRRNVTLGIRGDGATEITGGVEDGEVVIVPDGRQLAPGTRVRTGATWAPGSVAVGKAE